MLTSEMQLRPLYGGNVPMLLNTDDVYSNVLEFAVIACTRTGQVTASIIITHSIQTNSYTTYFQLQNKLAYEYH